MKARIKFNRAELAAITRTPVVTKRVRQEANLVRKLARRAAPKRTGAGARSIGVQRWYDTATKTVAFRVTWDRKHFYMIFVEDGTHKVRARHFLRGAGETVRNNNQGES